MKYLGWLGGLVLLGAVAGGLAAWQHQRNRPIREARTALAKEQYQLALRWLNWRLRQQPNDLEAMRLSARALARLGEDRRAEQLFQQIPDLEAEDYFLLGLCLSRQNEYPKAVRALQQAVDLAALPEARRILAVAYAQLDRPDLAIEQAQAIVDDPIEGDLALALLGQLYLGRAEPRASYDAYAKLLERNPKLGGIPFPREEILLDQADALIQIGEAEKAAELLAAVPEIDKSARSLTIRGRLSNQRKDVAAAEKDWLAALRLDPDNAPLMIELGLVLIEANRNTEAIAWLERAAKLDAANPVAHQHLAVAYTRAGDSVVAEQHRQKAKELRDRRHEFTARTRELLRRQLRGSVEAIPQNE